MHMYGYEPRKRPELGELRVMICESEIGEYLRTFPSLTREQILGAMIGAGPTRAAVESELERMAVKLGREARDGGRE
jgi:hypothetical protein